MEVLDVKSFSGGLADEELSVTPQHYTRADNLLFTSQYDLITRPGSVLYDTSNPQLPSGQNRVNYLINYDQDTNLLAVAGTHLYYYNSGWTEINGGAGGASFLTGAYTDSFSSSEWKKHVFMASSAQLTPSKIFKNQAGTFQSITAGLPYMSSTALNYNATTATASLVTLANDLRTQALAHFTDTAIHVVADGVSAALVGAAATNLSTLLTLTSQLQAAYINHFNDYQSAHLYHTPEITTAYTSVADQTLITQTAPTTLHDVFTDGLLSYGVASVLNDLKVKFNSHDGKADIHKNAIGAGHLVTTSALYGVTVGPWADLDRSLFYAIANNLKTSLIAHINDFNVTPGDVTSAHKAKDTVSYNDLNPITAATTPETLRTLIFHLRGDFGTHETDASAGTPTYHRHTEASSHVLNPYVPSPTGLLGTYVLDFFAGLQADHWTKTVDVLNALQTQLLAHQEDTDSTATSHAHLSGSNHYINFGLPDANVYYPDYAPRGAQLALGSYLYALTYTYSYQIGAVTFTMEGPPLIIQAANVIKPEIEGLLIQGIVPLANSGSTNYDLSGVTINVYRTVNGGSTLFYLTNLSNATTSFTDTLSDTILQTRRTIYTDGGVVDNEPAPKAKYVHIVDDTAYWGNLIDGSEQLPNQIRQSVQGTLDAVPGDFSVDLPYPNTGVSSIRGIRVAWTKKGTYRLEGVFDSRGNGSIAAVTISDSVGNVAGFAPIQTDSGLIFCGNDGFYVTDGYKIQKLSKDWKTTYLNYVRSDTISALIYGTLDKKQKRVWFTLSSTGSENDSFGILDLNLDLKENSAWTTASNSTYFAPTSVCIFNDQIIRGDSRGYVFKHDPTYLTDPKINTATTPSGWNTRAIFPDYRSPANDFGSIMVRKFVPKIVVKAKNRGNLSLQINSINDGGSNIAALYPIRYRGSTDYGDATLLSVGGGPTVSGGGLPEYKRHFPSGSLRLSTKQVQFILAKVAITNSDTVAQGVVNHAAKTITVAGATFPDYVDHVIAFANDSYVREFTINANTATVLTVTDAGGNLPANGTYKWVIRGYPKDEKWQLVNYLLHYELLPSTQLAQTDATGENA